MNELNPLSKTFELLLAVAEDKGHSKLATIAAGLNLPISTVHRLVAQLRDQSLLIRIGKGRYIAGPALVQLTGLVDPIAIFREAARPHLKLLVKRKQAIAHLGVWHDEMVTYLIKESGVDQDLFTREGGQLEAYCSAIGRVLLANLSPGECDAYLSDESFVPLTPNTETDPIKIRRILDKAHRDGFAIDREEISEGLYCIAVPVMGQNKRVVAALSLSTFSSRKDGEQYLKALRSSAAKISDLIVAYNLSSMRTLHV